MENITKRPVLWDINNAMHFGKQKPTFKKIFKLADGGCMML
jgi:hypothetical protein